MSNFQILNNVDHKYLRIVEAVGPEFGDVIHSCPAYTFEFRDLQVDFPILLLSLIHISEPTRPY